MNYNLQVSAGQSGTSIADRVGMAMLLRREIIHFKDLPPGIRVITEPFRDHELSLLITTLTGMDARRVPWHLARKGTGLVICRS